MLQKFSRAFRSPNTLPDVESSPKSSRTQRGFSAFFSSDALGGLLLILMAGFALVWANSAWSESYYALRDFRIGFAPWGLELSLGTWASDGLLAIFFFVVGIELKREFVSGDLRQFRTAAVPIASAVGGVAVPALLYVIILQGQDDLLNGWAIPTATDIAFALAVFTIVAKSIPRKVRLFLLTLAVVDDLIAIGIIAIFYTASISFLPLFGSLAIIALYGVLLRVAPRFFLRFKIAAWLILLPIGFVAWVLMHESGVHATIAAVLLGFTVPVLNRAAGSNDEAKVWVAASFEHRFNPISSYFALPIFAFFAAGVTFGGLTGLSSALNDPLVIAIIVALVFGKPIGIVSASWLITRFKAFRSPDSLSWKDLFPVGILAGVGFTVSLLIAELSFDAGSSELAHAKLAILMASLIAALVASIFLSIRNRHYLKQRQLSPGSQ